MSFLVTPQARRESIKPALAELDQTHPLFHNVTFAAFGADGRDVSPGGKAATAVGTPSITPGLLGESMLLDHSTPDYYSYESGSCFGPDTDKPFTAIARVFINSMPEAFGVISLQTAGATAFQFLFSTNSSYYPVAVGCRGSSPYFHYYANTGAVATGQWLDVAADWDGSAGTGGYRLFYNGEEQTVISSGNFANGNVTNLGANSDNNFELDGLIDYVMVLRGVNVADRMARPEQVLELIESPSRTRLTPSAGGATPFTAELSAATLAATSGLDLTVLHNYAAELSVGTLAATSGLDITITDPGFIAELSAASMAVVSPQDLSVLHAYAAVLGSSTLAQTTAQDLTVLEQYLAVLTSSTLDPTSPLALTVYHNFAAILDGTLQATVGRSITIPGGINKTWLKAVCVALSREHTRNLIVQTIND